MKQQLAKNLLSLKEAAIDAIKEFERYHTLNFAPTPTEEVKLLAAHSCAMTKAYAIMTGIGYDETAEMLHREASTR